MIIIRAQASVVVVRESTDSQHSSDTRYTLKSHYFAVYKPGNMACKAMNQAQLQTVQPKIFIKWDLWQKSKTKPLTNSKKLDGGRLFQVHTLVY